MENKDKKFDRDWMNGCFFTEQPNTKIDLAQKGPFKFEIKGEYGTITATAQLPELLELADADGRFEAMIINIKADLNTDAMEKIAKKDGTVKFYIGKMKEPKELPFYINKKKVVKQVTHYGYTLKPVDINSQPQKTNSKSELIKGKDEDGLPF